jgi:O-6-methylguanine DNA methyltransferase
MEVFVSAVYWSHLATPLGDLFAAASEAGLRRLMFGVSEAEFLSQLGAAPAHRVDGPLTTLIQQLEAYFGGERIQFNTKLDLSTRTPFQQQVMHHVYAIPFGQTHTYGQVAEAVGRPNAARAVGGVMAANPLPLIVPCHRVVPSTGGLGGYSSRGGLSDKRYLLRLEGAM